MATTTVCRSIVHGGKAQTGAFLHVKVYTFTSGQGFSNRQGLGLSNVPSEEEIIALQSSTK
jgi:hypothetical protein